jgi:tryptophan-rich sensory protein
MRPAVGLIVILLVTFLAPVIGASSTASSVGTWYQTLQRPPWSPPNWLFGPVWTLLYLMMAVAAWLVWRRGGEAPVTVPLALYAVQLALNAAWSPLFFGLRSPLYGLICIGLMGPAILATLIAFWRVRPAAGAMMVPYLLWVSFATALNYTLWRLNP